MLLSNPFRFQNWIIDEKTLLKKEQATQISHNIKAECEKDSNAV